jgi:aminoglycoside/choline kinase family phosphotransferase
MTWTESTGRVNEILAKLYKEKFEGTAVSFKALYAHGSDRDIIRLAGHNGNTVIGIYNNSIPENNAFIKFSGHFRSENLRVPEIFHVSEDTKSYLMEDLGDITLLNKINNDARRFSVENTGLYKKAIEQLIRFQTGAGRTIDYGLCYQFKEFGRENIEFDLEYFKQRFLLEMYKEKIDEVKLENDLAYLKSKLLEPERDNFLYRDFQSRNIMLHKNDLYFIDYQSGRKGALQYDIASLLYDARADIPQELREELLEYYIETANKTLSLDAKEFKYYFWCFAVIRILQAMGAYGYLGITKGKKRFLESIPYALKNIGFILSSRIEKGKLEYLKKIFTEIKYETAPN